MEPRTTKPGDRLVHCALIARWVVRFLFTGLAVALALGGLPAWAERTVVVIFWIFVSLALIGSVTEIVKLTDAYAKRISRYIAPVTAGSLARQHQLSHRTRLERYIGWSLSAVAIFSLLAAGHPALAGMLAISVILAIIRRIHYRVLRGEINESWAYPAARAISALIRFAGPFLFRYVYFPAMICAAVLVAPVMPIALPLMWPNKARIGRRLREFFEKPDGLIYFVYSELHQREHFLGPNGVLFPYRKMVVSRDWHRDIAPKKEALGRERFRHDPEGQLLNLCNFSRIAEHQPSVAVVDAHRVTYVESLCRQYYTREHDGGAELEASEEYLRTKLAEAFGPPPLQPEPPAEQAIGTT